MTANGAIVEATLARLVRLGVADFVVCAGARNVPLVASLLAIRETLGLRIWHHPDERTASFFALGLAKRDGSPVAVTTTSGTAAAELLPATIEARYSGIPLVLLTADRPRRFRGSGAPQAIEQVDLLDPYASPRVDIEAPPDLAGFDRWDCGGPSHLNLCFEEPSREDRIDYVEPVEPVFRQAGRSGEGEAALSEFVSDREGLVVLLGELPRRWRGEVVRFVERLAVPVWAEASSGVRERFAGSDLGIQRESGPERLAPNRVLRIGGVPSLRFWRDLEDGEDVEVLSISPRPFTGLARRSELIVCDTFPNAEGGVSDSVGPAARSGDRGEELLSHLRENLEACLERYPASEPSLVRRLSEWIPGSATVFLGNSLPIREWNLAATPSPAHPDVHASRGANGIDGQIATFLGLSCGREEAWGVFGDLTALYDLNSPALLDEMPVGRRRIVILNNGGGRIFSRLPSMAHLSPPEKAVTENRHGFDFSSWAAMWGMEHFRWDGAEPFPNLRGERVILEIVPDEAETEAFWSDLA